MKKLIYDGQEFEEYIDSTNEEIKVNKVIIDSIMNVGQNLSHEIYEVGEIDNNIDPNEVIKKWMKIYFEDIQDGSIKYETYLSDNMVCDNKNFWKYICEIEYSIIGNLNKPVFKFNSKIKYHTES